MNPVHARKTPKHAASSRLPRMAVISSGLLAVAATAGIALSQLDGPQPANASSTVTAATADRAQADRATRSQARNAAPAEPVTPPAPPAPPEKVLEAQFQQQPNFYWCGPAAARNALAASGHQVTQADMAPKLRTTTSGTDSAFDVTRGLNEVVGGNVYQTREIRGQAATPAEMDQLQADVVRAVSSGRAVVANIVRSAVDTNGGRHSFDGGHYVAIVGYKDEGRLVKVADSANPNGDGTYWMTTINLANWIAQHGYSY